MAETLYLTLLGKPQIFLGERPVTGLGTAKAQALLYYLVVTGRPHSREVLVELLWGDMPEAKAKRNLTTTLTTLRRAVGAYLIVEPQNVAFNFDTPHQVDVIVFKAAIEEDAALEPQDLDKDLAPLRQAVNLYAGDFLEGFYVKNALSFEEWVLEQRERLRELMLQALHRLIEHYAKQPEADRMALEYTSRLLALDPWRESAHRQMMILLGRSGQRSAALAQYETCRRILAEEFGAEPAAETIAIYERLKVAETPPPHNLPSQPNVFVGRVKELNQLVTHIDNVDCRLLTLVGPGGIGKTRLAIEGARRYVQSEHALMRATFFDGIYIINLAPITLTKTPSEEADGIRRMSNLLASVIADALNYLFQGPADLMTQLLYHLQKKEMLLILDNFDHLIEEASVLADILQNTAGIKFVVTSRERLNLMEEWVMEIEGLEFPKGEWGIERSEDLQYSQQSSASPPAGLEINLQPLISNLESFSAIALFIQQAQQIRADFNPSETDATYIARICQLVEGIPLALILAASWLRGLSVKEIVQEVERSLDFLIASQRNIPVRHRSLRAVFEQSWQMLSKQEQLVFRKISLFRSGFRREAAEVVAGASVSILVSLADKSLLRLTASGRYEIHELLRQYAAEKLNKDTQIDLVWKVWERYSIYYLNFVTEQQSMLEGHTAQKAVAEIRAEMDNIRQAWQWAVNETELKALQNSIEGLSRFYEITNWFQEGETTFGQATTRIRAYLSTIVSSADNEIAQPLLAHLLARQARLLIRLGSIEQAIQIAQAATKLAGDLHNLKTEAIARQALGEALRLNSVYDRANDQLNQALELAQTAQLPRTQAEALRELGSAARSQGHYAQAEPLFQQALTFFRALEDPGGEGTILLGFGSTAYGQGNYAEAHQRYDQALRLFRDIGNRWGESIACTNLARLTYEMGNYSQAHLFCSQALIICDEIQDHLIEAHILHILGNLHRDQGSYEDARNYYDRCLQFRHEIGHPYLESFATADFALLVHHLGQEETAYDYAQQARQIAEDIGVKSAQALALTNLGRVLVALNRVPEAANAYQQALNLRRSLGEHRGALRSLAGLAETSLRQGKLSQALAYTEEILSFVEENTLAGIREPFRIYLICYRILRASQGLHAQKVLEMAYRLLHERAAVIEDAGLQRSFLDNVPAHREIVREFHAR